MTYESAGLEELRLRLRGLVPFLDKKKRKIVYTDFQDEVMGVREEEAVYMPKMTGAQYEKKVKDYLRNHLDHLVIRRLRTNQPLTAKDLQGLEKTLAEIGEEDGRCSLRACWREAKHPRWRTLCAASWASTVQRHSRRSLSSLTIEVSLPHRFASSRWL